MPKTTLKLTASEKNNIINKHRALVDEFNAYLPDEFKIEYNKDLETILEDEKSVKYYKMINALNERDKKQIEIYKDNIKDNPIPQNRNYLQRTLWIGLKTENTDMAKEYNKKYLDEFRTEPEKIFYQRYKKVLEFNPKKLLDVIDDKEKLVEFYYNNQELCDDAFVFNASMDNNFAKINPELKNAVPCMVKIVEALAYPMIIARSEMDVGAFIFPQLTKEQAAIIVNAHPKYMDGKSPLRKSFSEALDHSSRDKIKNTFKTITDFGYKLEPGLAVKYQALMHDPKTNKDIEISLEDGIKNLNNNGNICVRERQPEEIAEIMKINNAHETAYLHVWQKNFSNNYNKNKEPFDFEKIKYENKGGFFERAFNRTSVQYRDFIQVFQEYNDPQSKNYLNKDLLKEKAENYFDYKTEKGISFSKLDETSKGRLKLVSSVIKTINDMDKDEDGVNRDIENYLKEMPSISRKPFLEENDVEDEPIADNLDCEENIIAKENSIDL